MQHEIKTIPLIHTPAALPCVASALQDQQVTEDHPAVAVMTDFEQVKPITVEPACHINVALERMKNCGVRLLLVADEQGGINGVITSYDIQSEKPINYARENDISHTAIRVSMIMTPLHETPAFDLAFVKQSLVRHVINTMKQLRRPHTLVIDTSEEQQRIRGLFSTSQISKILGRSIYQPLRSADSFAELQQEIE